MSLFDELEGEVPDAIESDYDGVDETSKKVEPKKEEKPSKQKKKEKKKSSKHSQNEPVQKKSTKQKKEPTPVPSENESEKEEVKESQDDPEELPNTQESEHEAIQQSEPETEDPDKDQNDDDDAAEKSYDFLASKKKSIGEIKEEMKPKKQSSVDPKAQSWKELNPNINFNSLPSVNVQTEAGELKLRYFILNDEYYYVMKDIYEKSTLESAQSIIQKKAKQGNLDQYKISDGKDMHWVSTPKKIAAAIAGSTKMATRMGLLKFFSDKHEECKEYYNPNVKKRKKMPDTSILFEGSDSGKQSESKEKEVTTPKKRRNDKSQALSLTSEQNEAIAFALTQITPLQGQITDLSAAYQASLKQMIEMSQKISSMKVILESTLHKGN
jgi:hypothetical protein